METPSSPSSFLSDQAADKDLLGFQPYAEAVLDIIRDPKALGPLVIGLYGTWGSGKTSLMKLVQAGLEGTKGATYRLAWFDAWKYEKEDALWRALLLRVLDNLRERDGEGSEKPDSPLNKDIERME